MTLVFPYLWLTILFHAGFGFQQNHGKLKMCIYGSRVSSFPVTYLELAPSDGGNDDMHTVDSSAREKDKSDDSFDSLDVMLERARKRPGPMPLYRLQAWLDGPILKLDSFAPSLPVFTRSDALLIAVAIFIRADGFALGLVIGKLTATPFRKLVKPPVQVQILLMPFWPVLWAIGLDRLL
jgi:hypothetical protein